MSKNIQYVIISLVCVAVLMFVFFFLSGKKEKEYTIIFDSNGGTIIANQIVKEGNKATKPENPIKENYNFLRWEYQDEEYDFTSVVESDMTLKAIWEEVKEAVKYDITFTVNGKTKTITVDKITDNDITSLGFEEKSGYELNWYLDGKEYDLDTPLTGNVALTGKYEKVTTYTVTFNSGGGTKVDSQKVKPKEKAKDPGDITKYGFIFEGWYLGNTKYDFTEPVTKNITLTAKWSEDSSVTRYEVTFDTDGGTAVSKQRVIESQTATAPKNPTKSGYTFLGWYLNDKKYDFKTKVTKNVTLKAKWEKLVEYTVTFDKNNGTANETKKVTSGTKVTKPSNPTRDGYAFSEWLLDNKPYDFNKAVTSDITLVASYKKVYTVTFDSDGGSSVASQKVTSGNTAKEPSKPTKNNNDFVEWQLNGSKYNFNTAVTSDITLTAIWQEKPSTDNYKVVATKADKMSSPDSILKVYKNGTEISFNQIKKLSGSFICNGTLPVVTTDDIIDQSVLLVRLSESGPEVRATLEIAK